MKGIVFEFPRLGPNFVSDDAEMTHVSEKFLMVVLEIMKLNGNYGR